MDPVIQIPRPQGPTTWDTETRFYLHIKKEWTGFCYCCFVSSVEISLEEDFLINALISYLLFHVTNEMITKAMQAKEPSHM